MGGGKVAVTRDRMHASPVTTCFGCGANMNAEQGKNGGWCVRCPECRQRVRRYEHQKMRRRAEEAFEYEKKRGMADLFAQTHTSFVKWMGHDCEKLAC